MRVPRQLSLELGAGVREGGEARLFTGVIGYQVYIIYTNSLKPGRLAVLLDKTIFVLLFSHGVLCFSPRVEEAESRICAPAACHVTGSHDLLGSRVRASAVACVCLPPVAGLCVRCDIGVNLHTRWGGAAKCRRASDTNI